MMHVIRMPDLGEGIAEVEVVAWRVLPGDVVAEDQVLADVMTDKATVEIPSPVSGRVASLGCEIGTMLAVGADLIRIELEGEGATPPAAPSPSPAGAAKPPAAIAGTTPVRDAPAIGPSTPGQRPLASPAVRARARELGIELGDVPASGPGGRVVHADLDACVARASGGRPGTVRTTARPSVSAAGVHSEKIVGLRRKIAQRMQDAKRRIPHFTYVEEVDVSELEALRERLNAKWGASRGHLTLLAFLVRAVVVAVREFPQVNARFDDDAGVLSRHDAVHVGIATQTDAGLLVPVLRDAQVRDLWGCAAEVVRLADAARSGKAVRDELTGSTITITSLGRLGGIMSTPVINHPEVAIVGVNRIALRPAIRDGMVVARQMMNLSSSFDHRVVDGAVAATFVQYLREHLEHPAMLFVE